MADAVVSISTGRVAAFLDVALIPLSVDANGATYTAASGGLPFDIFAALAAAGNPAYPISTKDILGFVGVSRAGYTAGQFAVGTVTSTTVPCTMKLWNGTTQFSNGACTQVVDGFLLLARGGAN